MSLIPVEALTSSELIRVAEGDRFFDYCLEPYRPRRPTRGKLRAENLLWHSLKVGGQATELGPPMRALQRDVGRDLTVWGVKWIDGELRWELYLYDPRKEAPEASATAMSASIAPWFEVVPRVREATPYMMVSFDLSSASAATGRIEELNLYLTGEDVHAGRSYIARAGSMELANTYRFMETKREIDAVLPLVKSSAFVDFGSPATLSKVLIPELFACRKVCVAKKRHCDAIYYSGIAIDQLLWFLDRFEYPAPIRDFARRHSAGFDHLWFDVGVDYRQAPDGTIEYLKTSYYGTL